MSGAVDKDLRLRYYEDIIGGDSGNPTFLVFDDAVILLHAFWVSGGGPCPTVLAPELQAAMNLMSVRNGQSTKSLRFMDFSSFGKLQREAK